MEKYTSIAALASAPIDDVLAAWSGLGYYSRARHLHKAAAICVDQYGGELPRDFAALSDLPGIGRSTAGAILAQAHGLRFAILDGNVKRVLSRYHGVRGWPGATSVQNELWRLAESHTPHKRVVDYTQAIMDLGATVCTRARPRCTQCPLASDCVAKAKGLTACLPASKPSRALPTRETLMLIVRDADGRLLLQRRPSAGVWAELWSLPEAADLDAAKSSVATIARRRGDIAFRPLPRFTHTFSHYRLDITPLACDVERAPRVADVSESRWLLPEEAARLGLPAPVRKLIEAFTRETE